MTESNPTTIIFDNDSRLKLFIEHAPVAIAMFDQDMRYLAVSKRWLSQYKIEHTNIIGELHFERFPRDQKKFSQALTNCLIGNTEKCTQDSNVDEDGKIEWTSWEMQPWFNLDGVIGGVIIFRDVITEHINAICKSKHTEQQMRMLAEKVPALFSYVDQKLKVHFQNNLFKSLFISNTDSQGTSYLADHFDKQTWEKLLPRIEKVLTGETVNFIEKIPDKNGVYRWLSIIFTPDINEKKTIQGFLILMSDITEQKKYENALRLSEQRYNLAVEASNDGIWDHNLITGEIYYSPRFKQLLGFNEDESNEKIKASFFDKQLHPDDINKVKAAFKQVYWLNKPMDIEYRSKNNADKYRWFHAKGLAVTNSEGDTIRVVGSVTDVTNNHKIQKALQHQANHDPLTKLLNRRAFDLKLGRAIRLAKQDNATHILCAIDLDRFKFINDACGHTAGDKLLFEIAKLMKSTIRKSDVVARIGGDEFGLIIHDCTIEDAFPMLEKVSFFINSYRHNVNGRQYKIGASIGATVIDSTTFSKTAAKISADNACYIAKQNGRNQIYIEKNNQQEVSLRAEQVNYTVKVKNALIDDNFVLFFQSIIPNGSLNNPQFFEVLLRIKDEENKFILPGAFMPAAERYGLITKIDIWVIKSVFSWLKENLKFEGKIFINISPTLIDNKELLKLIVELTNEMNVPTHKICFELTEASEASQLEAAKDFVNRLKSLGYTFALDDFGNGFSSYKWLRLLPVEYIKIDGQYIKNILTEPTNLVIVESIIQMAHKLGKKTIAEFIENEEVLYKLKSMNVDFMQGFYIHKPQPLSEYKIVRSNMISQDGFQEAV